MASLSPWCRRPHDRLPPGDAFEPPQRHGLPARTYLMGESMGGAIVTLTPDAFLSTTSMTAGSTSRRPAGSTCPIT